MVTERLGVMLTPPDGTGAVSCDYCSNKINILGNNAHGVFRRACMNHTKEAGIIRLYRCESCSCPEGNTKNTAWVCGLCAKKWERQYGDK